MKDRKTTIIVMLLLVATIMFVLSNQNSQSQSPPPSSSSFNAHFTESAIPIGAAVLDEEGTLHTASTSLALPILNRAVRVSVTFTGVDGEIGFGQAVACYKSSTGEYGFQYLDNGALISPDVLLPLLKFDAAHGAIQLAGGTNGTIEIRNFHTASGSVHIAFWY